MLVDRSRGIETEARKRTCVPTEVTAVEPDVGDRADSIELQKVTVCGRGRRRLEPQSVPTRALDVVGLG